MTADEKKEEKVKQQEEEKPEKNAGEDAAEAAADGNDTSPQSEKKKSTSQKLSEEPNGDDNTSTEDKEPKPAETGTYTEQDLKKMTVAQLRDIAKGLDHEAVKGYSQLNKEKLLAALIKTLDVREDQPPAAADKQLSGIKATIKKLKKQRLEALEAHDHARLKEVRRHIHRLKRKIRKQKS